MATRGKSPLPRGSGGSARQLPGQIPGRSALSEEPVPLRQSDRYERELCPLLTAQGPPGHSRRCEREPLPKVSGRVPLPKAAAQRCHISPDFRGGESSARPR